MIYKMYKTRGHVDMNAYYKEITAFIDSHRDEMIEKWKTLVNLEGKTDEKDNVEKAQAWLRKEFEAEGFECYIRPSRPDRAGVLVGILGKDRPGAPVIFSGHIDTVHRTGSFGGPTPFKIVDGKAYGPGVLDMKGGIIIALYVIKALNHIGYKAHPIKILFAGDEEGGHRGTDVGQFFENESRGALCAFNMETGHITNALCVGRKTGCGITAVVHGLGGHSGNEFTKGHNAVHESVLKCAQLIPLTDLSVGTTVTVSVITSGGNTNKTTIPELSEFGVDIRYCSTELGDAVLAKVDEIMHKTFVPGTTTEYEVSRSNLFPFQPNPQILRLLTLVNQVAEENGFPQFGQIQLGGASDAGAIAAAGVPVLCSCGVIGEFNHNIHEYAVVDSLFSRAKIYAMTVTELDRL